MRYPTHQPVDRVRARSARSVLVQGGRARALPFAVPRFRARHALQRWCPPIPVLRPLGVRTLREVQCERHALKALRGDHDALPLRGNAPAAQRVQAALAAVDA